MKKTLNSILTDFPVATHAYLLGYFERFKNVGTAYYNPYSIYGFIADQLNSPSINYSAIKIAESGLPIVELTDRFCAFAPESWESVKDVLVQVKATGKRLLLYAPGFLPPEDVFSIHQNRPQMIYDCFEVLRKLNSDLTDNTKHILNSRGRTYLSKNLSSLTLKQVTKDDAKHLSSLLDAWTNGPAGAKKDRLRLMKDHLMISWATAEEHPLLHAFIGFRNQFLASYFVLATLPGYPEMVTQVVSKSLNYKSLPGGYNNTSTWEIYKSCEWCVENGIKFINASGTDHNTTHRTFKSKFSSPSLDVEVSHWISNEVKEE